MGSANWNEYLIVHKGAVKLNVHRNVTSSVNDYTVTASGGSGAYAQAGHASLMNSTATQVAFDSAWSALSTGLTLTVPESGALRDLYLALKQTSSADGYKLRVHLSASTSTSSVFQQAEYEGLADSTTQATFDTAGVSATGAWYMANTDTDRRRGFRDLVLATA